MERNSIKEILRENIFRQHLLSEVTKRLHEEEGEGISEEELKEKYPTLYELKEEFENSKGDRKVFTFFKKTKIPQINKEAAEHDPPMPSPFQYMNKERIESDANIVKKAMETLKEVINSGELTPEQKEQLEQGELVTKWYNDLDSNLKAREENKEMMKKKFKEAGEFYSNKRKWFEKYPLLRSEKLSSSKGESTPFIIDKILSAFSTGAYNGLRNLSPEQIEVLESSDDILKDIKAGETPEKWEFLGKGSNRGDVHDDSPMDLKILNKMVANNVPRNMQKGAAKVMRAFRRKNPDGMPDAYKNDFNAFYERIKALAYELGVDTFADAFQENEEMLRSAFEKYWRYEKGEEIDRGSDNDSGGVEASDEMSDEIDDEDDDNHEDPNYDPEDHR